MAGQTISLKSLARVLTLVALLLFLLPWAAVSCSPEALEPAGGREMAGAPTTEIARPTGLELALGTVELEKASAPRANAPPPPFSTPDPLLIAAALLIALSLAASILLRGAIGHLTAAGGLVLAGALSCYTMLVRVPKAVHAYFDALVASQGPNGPPVDPAKLAQMIQVGVEPGFWQMIAVLAAAVVLLLLSMPARSVAVDADPAEPSAG